ncbi:endonuclease III [Vairimorpha necatrix]|uniref:Endonuclease III n=1 Tax=Vairimorpha necatrix TaxID=6039 RepID=A0AAX4JED3_9MICR
MEIYHIIKRIRQDLIAPVDVIGCYSVPKQVEDKKLYTLISLIISAQTKDEINYQTMINICTKLESEDTVNNKYKIDNNKYNKKDHTKYKINIIDNVLFLKINEESYKYTKRNGQIFGPDINLTTNRLTLRNLQTETNLKSLLIPVGFYNKKYDTIKNLVNHISLKGFPSSLAECLGIKGLGRKMSILYLNKYYKIVGISVDTHVHRLSNLYKIVETRTPEETRKKLEEIVDKKEWEMFNNVLVGYGQVMCKKRKPRCEECEIYKKNSMDCFKF